MVQTLSTYLYKKSQKVDHFLVAQMAINGPRSEWKTLSEMHTIRDARTKLVHRT